MNVHCAMLQRLNVSNAIGMTLKSMKRRRKERCMEERNQRAMEHHGQKQQHQQRFNEPGERQRERVEKTRKEK